MALHMQYQSLLHIFAYFWGSGLFLAMKFGNRVWKCSIYSSKYFHVIYAANE